MRVDRSPFTKPGCINVFVALGVMAVAVFIAIMLTGCGTTPTAKAYKPPPAYTPPAYVAPAAVAPPASPLQTWWDSGGSTDWTTVGDDLGQAQTDAANQDLASVEADGVTLKNDALTAEQDGPPAGTDPGTYYFGAMAALAFAGTEMEFGNLSTATTDMQQASTYINEFETEVKAEGLDPSV